MTTEMPPQRHILSWPEERIDMAFRLIPAGSFRMGSREYYSDEEPVHVVKIPENFWIAETPVTQAQFALWTRAENIKHENEFKDRPDNPAETMNWRQAQIYCRWLTRTKADEFPDGYALACLPTEAEWEYACRAGTETEYYYGDGKSALSEVGWYKINSGGQTVPVRQKEPNGFGLYDLHGSVWEWCYDAWKSSAYRQGADGASDPGFQKRLDDWRKDPDSMNESRVVRGGSWYASAYWCRSTLRYKFRPSDQYSTCGFRICLVRGPASGREETQDAAQSMELAPGHGGRGTRPESDGEGEVDVEIPDISKEILPRELWQNRF